MAGGQVFRADFSSAGAAQWKPMGSLQARVSAANLFVLCGVFVLLTENGHAFTAELPKSKEELSAAPSKGMNPLIWRHASRAYGVHSGYGTAATATRIYVSGSAAHDVNDPSNHGVWSTALE